MVKKTFLVLICFISLTIFISTLHGQASKKTITLPSGEVVWDLNGEWEGMTENYGSWSQSGSKSHILKVTQTGSSIIGITMTEEQWLPKGSEYIRGELDKSGFKKVQILTPLWPLDCNGKISEDGNKMIIDDGEKCKLTLTRK